MDLFESLTLADDTEKQNVRSAVVLGKIRYDEQLAPFVRTSKVRLESSLVQSELGRIIAEVSAEAKADPDKVGAALRRVISDVTLDNSGILNKPAPREKLPSTKTFGDDTYSEGAPSGKDEKTPKELPGVTHTDVNDRGVVLEDEILEADDQIDITKPLNSESCVRCKKESALEDSPVCQVCTDALVALAKKKEALVPAGNPGTTPAAAPQQQQLAPTHVMPLNPNSPYQCTVCGRTGTWDEVNNHLQQALDVPHMTAKQQLALQDQQIPQMQPQQPAQQAPAAPQQAPAYHAMKQTHAILQEFGLAVPPDLEDFIKEAGEYEKEQDQDAAVDAEHAQDPSSHFDYVIENMANRAAARHFSAPTDQDISQIATTYGLDPGEVKQSIQGVASFGNFHGINGTIGTDPNGGQPPQGYTEVDLNNNGNGIQSHEAVVPMNLAIRKVSEDLKMDPNNVYDSVKSAYGGDLSDEYHTSVQGEFHFYLPQELMAKATQHPQPPTPDQQQQQQPPQPGMGQAPGMTPQQGPGMNMPQPDINQMQGMSSVLNDQQLEVLLTRDGKLADQRRAFNPPPGSSADLERMHKFNPANMNVNNPQGEAPSGQACPYCNGPMSQREAQNGICDNCSGQAGLPGTSMTQEKVSPSYM